MTPSPSPAGGTRRQATACDWCRSHKVKCDTQQPSCRNCLRRGIACITVNLRKPGSDGARREPRGRRIRVDRTTPLTPSPAAPRRRPTQTEVVAPFPQDVQDAIEYSPSPPQPAVRNFVAKSPHRLLPAIFLMPFHSEASNENTPLEASTSESLSGTQPSTSQIGDDTNVTLVTDKTFSRRQAVGSGSSQYVLVQWLDLFYAQCPTWTAIFPFVQQGLAYSLDVSLPTSTALPPLPDEGETAKLTNIFFTRIYPVFPVVDIDPFRQSLTELRRRYDPQAGHLGAQDYPLLACAYAVLSAAADEEAGGISEDGTRYLEAAYFLYARLVAAPHVTSVQALLLLALILRNRDKEGASWGSLSQAICMAQSLGLHRHMHGRPGAQSVADTQNEDLCSRIWWTAYILERAATLETGRPSLIRDEECDQIRPTGSKTVLKKRKYDIDYFEKLVRLAQLKARAINLLYGGKKERKPISALLLEMGRVDRALLDWADEFPESIRPGRDLFCGADELHLATYVSLQLHQTMIALHRPALMSGPRFLRHRINEYCADTPWHDRLHFSLCIGVASARAVLKAINDLEMYAGTTRLITTNQKFVAILVLGIYVTKVPFSLMNGADLALLSTFAERVEQEYAHMGQDVEFVKAPKILREQLRVCCSSLQPLHGGENDAREASAQPRVVANDPPPIELDQSMQLADLDESWSYFWNEGLDMFASHEVEQDPTNMYLLGLPQSWS